MELCKAQAFDLVLLDENMPGLSGLETLSAIKALHPEMPVVMVTKNEAEDLMDQAIGAQITDYLLKPVNPMQILLALKKHIHAQEIRQEHTEMGYRQDFSRIALSMDDAQDAEAWKELYKKLVHWELQLEEAPDSAMNELLRTQKEEANAAFTKFIRILGATSRCGRHPLAFATGDAPDRAPQTQRGKASGVGGARQLPLRSVAHAGKSPRQ